MRQSFLKIFYLFIHERHRETEREKEAETQAEGEAGSTQGAPRGIRSRGSRITPWAEVDAKPLSHPGYPRSGFRYEIQFSRIQLVHIPLKLRVNFFSSDVTL